MLGPCPLRPSYAVRRDRDRLRLLTRSDFSHTLNAPLFYIWLFPRDRDGSSEGLFWSIVERGDVMGGGPTRAPALMGYGTLLNVEETVYTLLDAMMKEHPDAQSFQKAGTPLSLLFVLQGGCLITASQRRGNSTVFQEVPGARTHLPHSEDWGLLSFVKFLAHKIGQPLMAAGKLDRMEFDADGVPNGAVQVTFYAKP